MLFHTWTFLIFIVVVVAGFFALGRTRFWVPWLLLASYVFYGAWNPYYLFLIAFSTALDFIVVRAMDRTHSRTARRGWLAVSLVNNLGLLGFFKYANFFIENINATFGLALQSMEESMPFGWEYVLPVGISFYTFQSMSYTIDFYRGNIEREPSFIRFATFVSFFPQLVAGPIERSKNLLPQFEKFPKPRLENFTDGASLFLVGLFKKVALANYLALYVERVYSDPQNFGAPALVLATFCFAWQIYFDFSGYTDMARGVARVMGFRLMLNFNNPYVATGLADFWARWHISLSTWFRDYVYIPLGGNRSGEGRTYANLLIVFLVSGFWHGASWTFVVWGALHAVGTLATRMLERSAWYRDRVPDIVKQVWVFVFVCFAWIYFRAESIDHAHLIIRRIFTAPTVDPQCPALLLGLVAAIWAYQFLFASGAKKLLEWSPIRIGLATCMILYLIVASTGGGEFIYFQF